MTSIFADKRSAPPPSAKGVRLSRGFSLTELAIVLGVFGMIVSGLWGITSIVKENIKRERAYDLVVLVVKNIRTYFQAFPNNALPGVTGSYSAFTTALVNRGLIPFDIVRNRTEGTLKLDHPWGPSTLKGTTLSDGGFFVCDNRSSGNCGGVGSGDATGQSFRIRFVGIPYGACISLLERLTGSSAPQGVTRAYVNGSSFTPGVDGTFPIPMSWSNSRCVTDSNASGNTIEIVYALRQNSVL